MWSNPKLGQWLSSPDDGQKKLIGPRPDSFVRKLLLLTYKGGAMRKKKKNNQQKITISRILIEHSNFRVVKHGVCSAEVGTQAPELKKIARELKTEPKLLKYKNIGNIMTFNISTLNTLLCIYIYIYIYIGIIRSS